MADLGQGIIERLREAFGNDSQETIAQKLMMTQGNVSKMLNGVQYPSLDTLVRVSEIYNVSVDWILGIKNSKGVNDIDIKDVSYEQVFLLINELYNRNCVEVADIGTKKAPRKDSDYIRINDPALSFMLRRRVSLLGVDESILQDWIEKHIPEYRELPLLVCNKDAADYFAGLNTANFRDGDWCTIIKEYLKSIKNNERAGQEDGRD